MCTVTLSACRNRRAAALPNALTRLGTLREEGTLHRVARERVGSAKVFTIVPPSIGCFEPETFEVLGTGHFLGD